IDLDHDGDRDLVGVDADAGTRLALVENLGGGVFTPARLVGPTFGPAEAVAVGDYDGDGWEEIAVGGSADGRVVTFDLDPAGALLAGPVLESLPLTAEPPYQAVDLDGDGADELILGVGSVRAIFAGSPSGLTGAPIPLRETGSELHFADLDGDGDVDLVSSDVAALSVLENFGGLVFGPAVGVPIAGQVAATALD
ncbi:MAG: VCBS repeat-containing protein, partial [Planctomycetota bacterium]